MPLPQTDLDRVALLGLLQEGVVVEVDSAPAGRLSPAPVLAGMIDDELTLSMTPVDIGQLPAVLVDAVEVGVALEDELLGRRLGRVAPGIERRQVRVLRADTAAPCGVQRRPVLRPVLLDQLVELGLGPGISCGTASDSAAGSKKR